MKFYIGIGREYWLHQYTFFRIPCLLSAGNSRLKNRHKRINHPDWILDSGGYSQIRNHGRYMISEARYVEMIKELGPRVAFCQDYMCEPEILAKTGLTIKDHQRLTLESYYRLRGRVGTRVQPVLQGQSLNDYLEHIKMYRAAGYHIRGHLWGLGSVCKRNGTAEIREIIVGIKRAHPMIRLHGFGIKISTFFNARTGRIYQDAIDALDSADSMAWNYASYKRGHLCNYRGFNNCKRPRCDRCRVAAVDFWGKVKNYADPTPWAGPRTRARRSKPVHPDQLSLGLETPDTRPSRPAYESGLITPAEIQKTLAEVKEFNSIDPKILWQQQEELIAA